MAVSTIAYTDEMVGAGHPTKADTLNKLTLVEHDTEGKHGSTAWASLVAAVPGPTFDHVHLTSGQVGFPATQVPSADPNTLDDYEEGSWTPAFTSTGATFGYESQSGRYTKIGRVVTLQFYIAVNALSGTTSNDVTITVPFACGDTFAGVALGFTIGMGYQAVACVNGSSIQLRRAGTSNISLKAVDCGIGTYLCGTAVYQA